MQFVKLNPDSVIDERKLKEYLLMPRIEDDKAGFLALAGYSLANWYHRILLELAPQVLIQTTQ